MEIQALIAGHISGCIVHVAAGYSLQIKESRLRVEGNHDVNDVFSDGNISRGSPGRLNTWSAPYQTSEQDGEIH